MVNSNRVAEGPPPATRHYCHHEAKDGRVCILYFNHFGDHKSKHLASSWSDGE